MTIRRTTHKSLLLAITWQSQLRPMIVRSCKVLFLKRGFDNGSIIDQMFVNGDIVPGHARSTEPFFKSRSTASTIDVRDVGYRFGCLLNSLDDKTRLTVFYQLWDRALR